MGFTEAMVHPDECSEQVRGVKSRGRRLWVFKARGGATASCPGLGNAVRAERGQWSQSTGQLIRSLTEIQGVRLRALPSLADNLQQGEEPRGAGRRLHPGPLLSAGSCLLPLCLDTLRTKICAAWPLSAHTEMLADFYRALRHRGGSRWGTRNAECRFAWCGGAGLANRWILLEWGCLATASPRLGFYGCRRLALLSSTYQWLSQALSRRRSRTHCG